PRGQLVAEGEREGGRIRFLEGGLVVQGGRRGGGILGFRQVQEQQEGENAVGEENERRRIDGRPSAIVRRAIIAAAAWSFPVPSRRTFRPPTCSDPRPVSSGPPAWAASWLQTPSPQDPCRSWIR